MLEGIAHFDAGFGPTDGAQQDDKKIGGRQC